MKVLEIHQQAVWTWVNVHISVMAEPLCSIEVPVYEQRKQLRFALCQNIYILFKGRGMSFRVDV